MPAYLYKVFMDSPIPASQLRAQVIEVEFSKTKISEIEYEVLKTFLESEFALSTSEVHNKTIERICLDRYSKLKKENPQAAKHLESKWKEIAEAKKADTNIRGVVESLATALREYYDVPTYPRVVRILESLESVGWVDGRRPSKEKSAILWAISDDVRKKMER